MNELLLIKSDINYEKEILAYRDAFLKVKEYGVKKILVCCYEDNEASKKVIIKNSGIFENKVLEPGDIK